MLPDFSEYNWVIPDFVWELSEQIDLGKCFNFNVVIQANVLILDLAFLIKDPLFQRRTIILGLYLKHS